MSGVDIAATAFINSFAGEWRWFDLVAIGVSRIGVVAMVAAVAARWWARQDRQSERHAALVCGISFLLGLGLNQLVLIFIHRPRPYEAGITRLLIPPSQDWSFPSDHATAALAIVFAYLLLGHRGKALAFAAAALLIALSRVYLGTHYVSDIIGGSATALIAAFAVVRLYRPGSPFDRWITSLL